MSMQVGSDLQIISIYVAVWLYCATYSAATEI